MDNYGFELDNDKKSLLNKAIGTKIMLIAIPIVLFVMLLAIVFIGLIGAIGGFGKLSGGTMIADSGTSCTESGFTIDKTSLSKSEFKQKLTEYALTNSRWQIFVDYSDEYYDYAKSVNVNPELVVTVANKEGQGKETAGSNNYWGLDCPNGSKKCGDYPSFMDGAKKIIDSASKWDSLVSWFVDGHYSWIGDYWYNPGDSGLGGCYYFNSSYCYNSSTKEYKCLYAGTNPPQRVVSACAHSNECSGSSCIKTIDEDQKEYAKYLISQMAKFRKTVFGLDEDSGVVCTNNGNLSELVNYNLNHNNLNVLNRTLSSSEIQDLNSYIESEINKAGYGTGAGVAAAGQSLIYWLERKGYYLQYYWGGGHPGYGDGNSTFTFANPNWGSTAFGSDDHYASRKYWGMDCSGFVSWATRTACKGNNFDSYSSSWIGKGASIPISEARPGDVMDKSGHVRLVIKNNGDGSIITAEESGSNNGLVFTSYSSPGEYTIVSMEKWYSENCNKMA